MKQNTERFALQHFGKKNVITNKECQLSRLKTKACLCQMNYFHYFLYYLVNPVAGKKHLAIHTLIGSKHVYKQ